MGVRPKRMSEIHVHYYDAVLSGWIIFSAAVILLALVIVGVVVIAKRRSRKRTDMAMPQKVALRRQTASEDPLLLMPLHSDYLSSTCWSSGEYRMETAAP
jgi:hypothetical protein